MGLVSHDRKEIADNARSNRPPQAARAGTEAELRQRRTQVERLEKELSIKEQQCRKTQGELDAVRTHTAESERALENDNRRLREERDRLRNGAEETPHVVDLRAKIERLESTLRATSQSNASRQNLEILKEKAEERAREAETRLRKVIVDRDSLAAMLREVREELVDTKKKVRSYAGLSTALLTLTFSSPDLG